MAKKTLLTNQAIRYRLVQVFERYSSIVGPHSPVSLTYPSALNPLPLRRFCVNSVITRFHGRSALARSRTPSIFVFSSITWQRVGRHSVGSGSRRSWHRISVVSLSLSPLFPSDHTGKYRIRERRDRHLNIAPSLPPSLSLHHPPLPCAVPPATRIRSAGRWNAPRGRKYRDAEQSTVGFQKSSLRFRDNLVTTRNCCGVDHFA